MISVHSPNRSPSAWRLSLARCGGTILLALMLISAIGCSNSAPTTGKGGGGTGGSGKPQELDDQCASVVSSIYDMFQLKRLGQTTSVADGVLRLNDWQQSCQAKAPSSSSFPDALRKLLTDDQLESLQSSRFTNRDGEHLRNGVVFQSLVRYAFDSEDANASELQRAVAAFQHVIRTIELVSNHPHELPFTPYEILLLGKGTAADRAWLFARLLQEAKIDAVLIVPSGKGEGDQNPGNPSGPFLVGVLLDGQTYLFDPRAGVPIPPPGGTETAAAARGVATLVQAADDPKVLKQLDVDEDHPYSIHAADLARPTVLLITDMSFSSERMRSLQGQFSGEHSMVISDPLQDSVDAPGLWARVAKAGGERWSAESLRIWSYPERQLEPHAALTGERSQLLRQVFSPFDAYGTPRFSPKQGKVVLVDQELVEDRAGGEFDPGKAQRVRSTKGAQMRARLTQLGGDFATAVQEYHEVWQRSRLVVRGALEGAFTTDEEKVLLHLRAIDDASFFTAACKFEQRNYRVATDALQRYRTQHPKGAWVRQCRYLLALSFAAQEDYEAAVEELEDVDGSDPEYAGYQWLIRRWQLAEPESEPPAEGGAKAGT